MLAELIVEVILKPCLKGRQDSAQSSGVIKGRAFTTGEQHRQSRISLAHICGLGGGVRGY